MSTVVINKEVRLNVGRASTVPAYFNGRMILEAI